MPKPNVARPTQHSTKTGGMPADSARLWKEGGSARACVVSSAFCKQQGAAETDVSGWGESREWEGGGGAG